MGANNISMQHMALMKEHSNVFTWTIHNGFFSFFICPIFLFGHFWAVETSHIDV